MSVFIPRRAYDADHPELMDRPDTEPGLLFDDLEHLKTINRRFGGLRAMRRSVLPLLAGIDPGDTAEILDLATGSADYPADLARWAKSMGRRVRIEAVDKNPFMVGVARRMTRAIPEIAVNAGDILSLPHPDRSFDIVLCSSAIHHFSRGDAVRILGEMNRLSRIGLVVNDLHRSWTGAGAAWCYSRLATTNPVTRHDACLSVLRGFREEELASMAREAGIRSFRIERRPFFRLILTGAQP